MHIGVNDREYEKNAKDLVCAITRYVDYHLKVNGVAARKRTELVNNITFSLCALLDGSANIPTRRRKPVVPVIGFLVDRKKRKAVLSETVSFHEMFSLLIKD